MEKSLLGWEEWICLPELGLPAIKAKVDTGARTSSLHAFAIEPFGKENKPYVRFGIHPVPSSPEIEIFCSAPIVDQREVTSSNGEVELRYIIETKARMGDLEWDIEVSLANRESMQYRMLIGRTAIDEHLIVDPNLSFQQELLSYAAYENLKNSKPVRRPLRIALLTREPDNYSCRRIIEAAEDRGHVCEIINTSRCYMNINDLSPEVHYDGRALPRYDAIIPRIGSSITSYGMAVVRQFHLMGAFCLNSARAIGASRDKLLAHQLLAQRRIGMPVTAFANSPKDTKELIEIVGGSPLVVKLLESTQGKGVVLAETQKAAESVVGAFRGIKANFLVQEFVEESGGSDIRCFVIGNKVVATMQRNAAPGEFRSNLHQGGSAEVVKITKAERETAVRAAKIIGLNVAGVDLLRSDSGPKVLEVNSSPGLEGVEQVTGKDLATQIVEFIETKVGPKYRTTRRRRVAAE